MAGGMLVLNVAFPTSGHQQRRQQAGAVDHPCQVQTKGRAVSQQHSRVGVAMVA